ncbi:MAG TPA: alpha/beta hydrolase [Myxococcaceae bacterium]
MTTAQPQSKPRPPPLPAPKMGAAGAMVLTGMRVGFGILGRLAPEMAADRFKRMYFTPRRPPLSGSDRRVLAQGRPFEVPFQSPGRTEYPGGALKAWRWGEGEKKVLLAHGWESRAAKLASAWVEPLTARGYSVIAADAPGHGDSPGVQSDMDGFATALLAVGAAQGPFHAVIGHSLGAASTTWAVTRGLQASRLVYLAPACWTLAFPERFCAVLGVPERARPALYRRLYQVFSEQDWVNLSGDILSAQLQLPGLIFHDDQDGEVHYEGGVAIHQAWKGSKLVTTKGLGHRRIASAPEVVKQVLEFLEG